MDDTPEVIRKQMDETKLQLVEKLESLEQQVTQTVQSTSCSFVSSICFRITSGVSSMGQAPAKVRLLDSETIGQHLTWLCPPMPGLHR